MGQAKRLWKKSKNRKATVRLLDPPDVILGPESHTASSTPTSTLTWISWFCSLPGHEYFCEVSEDFIEDDFNLTGLNAMVPFWKEAMDMVLDVEPGTLMFIYGGDGG